MIYVIVGLCGASGLGSFRNRKEAEFYAEALRRLRGIECWVEEREDKK